MRAASGLWWVGSVAEVAHPLPCPLCCPPAASGSAPATSGAASTAPGEEPASPASGAGGAVALHVESVQMPDVQSAPLRHDSPFAAGVANICRYSWGAPSANSLPAAEKATSRPPSGCTEMARIAGSIPLATASSGSLSNGCQSSSSRKGPAIGRAALLDHRPPPHPARQSACRLGQRAWQAVARRRGRLRSRPIMCR